jgi:SAM-dependent methyltransferase
MGLVETARGFWRDHTPARVRKRVNAVRTARREAAWRKPRDLGDLRRTTPFSTWGEARGGPIDRYYVERFLERHAADIRGRVLEIAGDEYVCKFGRRVERTDILDIKEDNPNATFVADLVDAPNVPDDTFDCVLVTQLLPFVYDFRAALRTAHRILGRDGVLLVTTPGLCRIAPVEAPIFGHWWGFTSMSAKRVCEEIFGADNVEVQTYGNVLAAAAFLFGLGPYDVTPEELAVHDPDFQVTIGVRAVKRG